jgi:hydrogenase nickel incorporation protein HypA/HybF
MHEMPVTKALLDMALKHADGRRITDVYLEVGKMSAIVPDSVEVFFQYLSEGTLAEGAELHFDMVPVEMTCEDCGRKQDLSAWEDESPQRIMQKAFARGCECGGKNLRVSGGVSFGLVSIDVEENDGG